MVSRVVGLVARSDAYFGGAARVVGTTSVEGTPSNVPVSRRVRLHDQKTGRLVRETWSADTGAYAFERVRADLLFYVVSFDHTGQYTGVIETDVVPEPML
jgi:hypothetical protein